MLHKARESVSLFEVRAARHNVCHPATERSPRRSNARGDAGLRLALTPLYLWVRCTPLAPAADGTLLARGILPGPDPYRTSGSQC
jgi:hypothetical protein